MVEQVDARGLHFRAVIQYLNREQGHETFVFRSGDVAESGLDFSDLEEALKKLARSPTVDRDSLHVFNAVDTQKRAVQVLNIPKRSADILDFREKDIAGLPNASETYVVSVKSNVRRVHVTELLVNVDNPNSAVNIAARRMRSAGYPKSSIELEARLVSPEEFVKIAKRQIDEGERISGFVLRYAGLRQYVEQVKAEKDKINMDEGSFRVDNRHKR